MDNNNCIKPIHSYQSANLTDSEIINHFIVRKKEFERLIAEIDRDDMSGAIQHFILVGRRGSGKSTLLRRIEAEVNTKPELNKKLIVVNLSEEQAGVYRLHDLWDLVIRALNVRKIQTDSPDWSASDEDLHAYSKSLYASIQNALQKEGKKLLLLLDNIDRIFDNIGADAHLLRELLMNHKDMRIIGGSTRMREHYWKSEMPFYQFFRIIRLESLKREEVKELLDFWSGCMNLPELNKFLQKNPGKIETIRLLTDGMPRTLLNFIEILIDRSDQNGFEYLRLIIDRATPVYQERLNSLPAAHRKIVSELSNFWDAVKVNQLTQACKMSGKLISAQMNQLVKDEMVEKISGLKRDNLYRLTERFFNLWLLMTQGGPKEKRQVKYLTVFLENWYDETELQTLCGQHLEGLQNGKLRPDYAALMTSALAHSRYLTLSQRDAVIERTRSFGDSLQSYTDFIPQSSQEIYAEVIGKMDSKDYLGARNSLKLIEQEDDLKEFWLGVCYQIEGEFAQSEKHLLKAQELGNTDASHYLADVYYATNRFQEAEKYCLISIDRGNERAIFNLAILYNQTDRLEEAKKYFLLAIEKGNIVAYNNLAYIYTLSKNFIEAEKCLKLAIDGGNIIALNNMGSLYKEMNRLKEAEKYYLKAIEKEQIKALDNLANLYAETNRQDEAEKYYLLAIQKGSVNANFYLALLYHQTDRSVEAEKYYLAAIENGSINALYNLANLLTDDNRPLEAEKYYLLAIDKGIIEGLNNLANLYYDTNRHTEAEKYYLLAIKKGNINALENLSFLYYNLNKERDKALNLAEEFLKKNQDHASHTLHVIILLWAGKMNEFEKAVVDLIPNLVVEDESDYLSQLFISFLIHSQYNLAWSWFNHEKYGEKLKELIRPLFYITAGFISGQEEEALKPGPELKETINDIRQDILERQKFYYGNS